MRVTLSKRNHPRRLVALAGGAILLTVITGCTKKTDPEAFCETAREFAIDNPAEAFLLFDPANPATGVPLLRTAAERLDQWAKQAPPAIDNDISLLAQGATGLADVLEEPTNVNNVVRTADLTAASRRVVDFTEDECQVDLTEPASPSTTEPFTPTTS